MVSSQAARSFSCILSSSSAEQLDALSAQNLLPVDGKREGVRGQDLVIVRRDATWNLQQAVRERHRGYSDSKHALCHTRCHQHDQNTNFNLVKVNTRSQITDIGEKGAA